ncbi:YjbQ family protein [Pectinatus sottacetonis]|uniref:YjbQ family protein n=1 Tax=Pectinatus sottacetonis TaxID=1002795 RepID=UPI0018C7698E|nr:YjbQ family protein [Pectinatus sottacetonis]
MAAYIETIEVLSNGNRVSYHEITKQVREIVQKSKIKNGIVVITSTHTTCSVIYEEYSHDLNYCGDEYLQVDFNNILEKIIPRCLTENQYYHPGPQHVAFGEKDCEKSLVPDRRSLLNTEAHLKASLVGESVTSAIENGIIQINQVTGYYYFIDWDQNRPRKRICKVAVMGE